MNAWVQGHNQKAPFWEALFLGARAIGTEMDTAILRQQFRKQRRLYPHHLQQQAAQHACRFLLRDLAFIRSRHIAIYWPQQGELDPRPIAQHAWRLGKKIYLPVLSPLNLNQLSFARFTTHSKLTLNRFGIVEPHATCVSASQMDLIICPLVAFNAQGYRLGMGGGFYDRTLAKTFGARTYGFAYSWQYSDAFAVEKWDIPLHGMITEQGIKAFH